MSEKQDKKKSVIGLYGEMCLAMELHERDWQVHSAYIDEGIDFVISKYYCVKCKKFTSQFIRKSTYQGKSAKCVTNLCHLCKKEKITIITRNIQVKTSESITRDKNSKNYSFHPKIRYDMGKNVFYIWIAVINKGNLHYYIFNTLDVEKFDDISIDTYQKTDNQKTTLTIDNNGNVLNKGKKYDYRCFKDFHNNFEILDKIYKK